MKESSMKTREKAINAINNLDADVLKEYLIGSHSTRSHRWVEVEPDGEVHQTEECDNYSTHWIDYPHKEVAEIYEISRNSAEPCSCAMCREYRDFKSMDKEDFVESYSQDSYEYWRDTDIDTALYDFETDNGRFPEDIREEMIDAVDGIEYGYFDDEDD